MDELDLSPILIPAQSEDPHGEKGFDPSKMLTMLPLNVHCMGIGSSRKIERAYYKDLAFSVLTGNQQTDYSRISEVSASQPRCA